MNNGMLNTTEEKIEVGTTVKELETNEVYTVRQATKTDNKWGYGVYLYHFEERKNSGFALYRNEFAVLQTPLERDYEMLRKTLEGIAETTVFPGEHDGPFNRANLVSVTERAKQVLSQLKEKA